MIDLAPEHLATVKALLARHVPECAVCAFGSRVKGNAKPYSDLDLAITGTARLAPGRLAALREAFMESDLPMRVDVVDWHAVSDTFRTAIRQNLKLIQSGD